MENPALSENQKLMEKQIKNSIAIINCFFDDKELSYTALQNALLSLVLLPYESARQHNNTRIWQVKYKDLKKEIGFTEAVFMPIKECKDNEPKFNNRTIYSFIKKFRNAIAHQNIEIVVDESRAVSIAFFNIFPAKCSKCNSKKCDDHSIQRKKSGAVDFKVSFTYEQLRKFALFVANSYLRSITGNQSEAS